MTVTNLAQAVDTAAFAKFINRAPEGRKIEDAELGNRRKEVIDLGVSPASLALTR